LPLSARNLFKRKWCEAMAQQHLASSISKIDFWPIPILWKNSGPVKNWRYYRNGVVLIGNDKYIWFILVKYKHVVTLKHERDCHWGWTNQDILVLSPLIYTNIKNTGNYQYFYVRIDQWRAYEKILVSSSRMTLLFRITTCSMTTFSLMTYSMTHSA